MDKARLFAAQQRLEGEGICLKAVEPADAEHLFRIYSDPEVFRYCGILTKKNPVTVAGMIPHFERDFRKQERIKWGIYQDGRLVGIAEVMDVDARTDMLTIGYFLAREFWHRGIAGRAVGLLVGYLFGEIGVNRIQGFVMPENRWSGRVLERNGFLYEGTLRQAQVWAGKGLVDLAVYARLRSDPPPGKPAG